MTFMSARYAQDTGSLLGSGVVTWRRAIGHKVFAFVVVTGKGHRYITVAAVDPSMRGTLHEFLYTYHTAEFTSVRDSGGLLLGYRAVCTCGEANQRSRGKKRFVTAWIKEHEAAHRSNSE